MTKPFEMRNPLPEAFDGRCDYIVPLLDPVLKPKGGRARDVDGKSECDATGAKKLGEMKVGGTKGETNEGDGDAIAKTKLAVGVVLEVSAVENSDKLYACVVDVGEGVPRKVVTGLRAYVPEGELRGAKVLTILNLKAAKLAGQISEAMILATEFEGKVKLVSVPAGAKAGDIVNAAGFEVPEAFPKECKSKYWAAVQEKLNVKGGKAYYGDAALACAAGEITADAPDGSGIK